MRFSGLLLLLICWLSPICAQGGSGRILLGHNDDFARYTKLLQGVWASCPFAIQPLDLSLLSEADIRQRVRAVNPELVIALGPAAAWQMNMADLPVPILNLAPDDALPRGNGAVVATNVSRARQIELYCKLFPRLKTFAVIHMAEVSGAYVLQMRQAARKQGVSLNGYSVSSYAEFEKALFDAEKSSDALIVMPEVTARWPSAGRFQVAFSVRTRKPLLSPIRYAGEGAVARTFIDETDLGAYTGKVACRIIGGESPGTIGLRYVKPISVMLNTRIIQLLKIETSVELMGTHPVFKSDLLFGEEG